MTTLAIFIGLLIVWVGGYYLIYKSDLLKQFRKKAGIFSAIVESELPSVEITPTADKSLQLWDSKFGGLPYLPTSQEYPKDSEGEHLHFLAQINFAQMPSIQPFPKKGILQFWIANDDLYGLDTDDQTLQDGFRVIFYPQIDNNNLVTNFDFVEPFENGPLGDNHQHGLRLSFKKRSMPVTFEDFRREKILRFNSDEGIEAYIAEYPGDGHRVGGYPTFRQDDPRSYNSSGYQDKTIMLLQIDSDPENDIYWGDGGIAQFFISEEDLKNKDFSNVLFNWDCS
tara:strand:- start:900 stop:1745 length:846 start_codon:yes stop_codon:yes gene_type:complete